MRRSKPKVKDGHGIGHVAQLCWIFATQLCQLYDFCHSHQIWLHYLIINFDDENNIMNKNVLHQVGKIWHVNVYPADKGVLATRNNTMSDSGVQTRMWPCEG